MGSNNPTPIAVRKRVVRCRDMGERLGPHLRSALLVGRFHGPVSDHRYDPTEQTEAGRSAPTLRLTAAPPPPATRFRDGRGDCGEQIEGDQTEDEASHEP